MHRIGRCSSERRTLNCFSSSARRSPGMIPFLGLDLAAPSPLGKPCELTRLQGRERARVGERLALRFRVAGAGP